MQANVIVGALAFCVFSLGLFLGGGVRPLLIAAMKREPALIDPIITAMFGRYNVLALGLSVICFAIEIFGPHAWSTISVSAGLVLVLALKLPFDRVIRSRESSGQVRGMGSEGMRLDSLHKIVERATAVILLLALALFVLTVVRGG